MDAGAEVGSPFPSSSAGFVSAALGGPEIVLVTSLRQDQFSLTGFSKAIEFALVLNPDLVAAASQVTKPDDLGENRRPLGGAGNRKGGAGRAVAHGGSCRSVGEYFKDADLLHTHCCVNLCRRQS